MLYCMTKRLQYQPTKLQDCYSLDNETTFASTSQLFGRYRHSCEAATEYECHEVSAIIIFPSLSFRMVGSCFRISEFELKTTHVHELGVYHSPGLATVSFQNFSRVLASQRW